MTKQAAAVDTLFAEYEQPGSPGLAVGVYYRGQPVKTAGYGRAHLEHDIAISPTTVFHVASVSKQFVAFSAALLEANGKLNLDSDIRENLPWVPDFGPKISPRQLIYHTSGLRDQWTLFVLGGLEMDSRLRQQQVVSMMKRQQALNFAPGNDYTYSNAGYTVLAELVGAVSGQSLREFTAARIFEPLGMTNTVFYDDVTEVLPNRAQSYEKNDDGTWHRSPLNFDNVGATSLHTTVDDLLAWAGNYLQPKVGSGQALARMHESGKLADGTHLNYGFALQKREIAGHSAISHSGADAGFRSIIAVFPDDDFAVTILANSPTNLLKPLEEIAAIYLTPDYKPGAWKKSLPATIEPDAALVKALQGQYIYDNRPVLTLEADNAALTHRALEDDAKPISFRDDGSFDFGDESRLYGANYRAVRNASGQITGIEMHGASPVEGQYFVYRKIERAQPRLADLEMLVGNYASPELDVTYTLSVKAGELTIESLWTAPITLHATVADQFEGEWPMHEVTVQRDADGRPSALLISSERARRVRLDRIE
ncbi:MAG: serine hydrolase domain-containing protein [Woeseia sp.]